MLRNLRNSAITTPSAIVWPTNHWGVSIWAQKFGLSIVTTDEKSGLTRP